MFQLDIIFAIPLGLLFYMFIEKLVEVVVGCLDCEDKTNKIILLLFVSGIVGIVLARTLFVYNKPGPGPVRYRVVYQSSHLMKRVQVPPGPQQKTSFL